MDKVSEHFSRSEFACQCGCGFDAVDVELLDILERIRKHYDKPVIITSGCRCQHRNTFVHGVPGSLHTKAKAADFHVKDTAISDVVRMLNEWYPNSLAIGEYSRHIHLGITEVKRRWKGTYWKQQF